MCSHLGMVHLQEVQKRTLAPKWEEDKWLLVQEPKTQILRAQVFDHDTVNLKVPHAIPLREQLSKQFGPVAPGMCVGVQATYAISRVCISLEQHFPFRHMAHAC